MGKIPELTECSPGLEPMEYNILIRPEVFEERSAGGIIFSDQTKEAQEIATMRGRLVAVSPLAFNFDGWPEGARKPQIGDAVLFGKYAGVLQKGADGAEYRLCKDRDLAAVIAA